MISDATSEETEREAGPGREDHDPPGPATAAPRPRRNRSAALVPALLGLLLLGLVATSTVLWLRSRPTDDTASVLTAGRRAAEAFFTLDHRHVDRDIDTMLGLSTGRFRDAYESKREDLAAGVEDQGLVVSAQIAPSGAAVEFLGDHEAQVLVAVDTVTTADGGSRTPTRYRTRVTLTQVDGEWLVSGVEEVG